MLQDLFISEVQCAGFHANEICFQRKITTLFTSCFVFESFFGLKLVALALI